MLSIKLINKIIKLSKLTCDCYQLFIRVLLITAHVSSIKRGIIYLKFAEFKQIANQRKRLTRFKIKQEISFGKIKERVCASC